MLCYSRGDGPTNGRTIYSLMIKVAELFHYAFFFLLSILCKNHTLTALTFRDLGKILLGFTVRAIVRDPC